MKQLYYQFYSFLKQTLFMKSRVLSAVFLCQLVLSSFNISAQSEMNCGFDQARKKAIAENPEILIREKMQEDYIKEFERHYRSGSRSDEKIIIPIVFHIVHQGGSENISDAQIYDQMRILNEDYNKLNKDTNVVVNAFKGIVADIGIEFRLAKIDPNGNCTNGIDRIYSVQTYQGNDYSKLNMWPRSKYLNVWVVRTMENGVAGYAYIPSTVAIENANRPMDGIIILQQYIGSIGTANALRSRALTHEIGHFLNLYHPWGSDNEPGVACGDDLVKDTPTTKGSTSCKLNLSDCLPGTIENVQNFMDYSYCSVMFTEGQKIRMLAAIADTVARRSTLTSQANLAAVGVLDSFSSPCAPKAAFFANKTFVCLGTKVKFTDNSYNGVVDYREWNITNAVETFSSDSIIEVDFIQPGWQTVSLTVLNAFGQSVKTDSMAVYVSEAPNIYTAPYFEGFEDEELYKADWTVLNLERNRTKFSRTTDAAASGNASIVVNNYYSLQDADIDEIISPPIDISGLSTSDLSLSFDYTLATKNTDFSIDLTDSIVVYGSANCGATWYQIYKNGKTSLVNAGYKAGYFIPPAPYEVYWKKLTGSIPTTLRSGKEVRFKFQVFSTTKGNNFYIDNINIGNAVVETGILDKTNVSNISIYPNPTTKESMVDIELKESANVSVSLYDITGRMVTTLVNDKQLNQGSNMVRIDDSATPSKGIYMVGIKTNGVEVFRKLVKQ
jgi:PKD repeat protein